MRITLITFLFLLTIQLSSQNDKAQRLTAFIEKAMETSQIVPGLSVAVAGKDGSLYQQGFGYANLEQQQAVTPQTSFYIASCTKAYNGLLAAILEEEGKLDLQQTILEYAPFRNFSEKEIFRGITVMDLLTHQSGIDNPYLSTLLAYSGEYTEAQILRLIEEDTQPNETGKAFQYTNYGYYLLDVIIQAEFGQSWRDLLADKIFQPLDMQQTTAYVSDADVSSLAIPYAGLYPKNLEPIYLRKTDATMHAAGGLLTNGTDAARLLTFYLNKGEGLYPQATVVQSFTKRVHTNHEFTGAFKAHGYALGWRLGQYADQEIAYHFGGYPGHFANLSFMPEAGIGVAVMANHGLSSPLSILISQYAYDLYLGNEKALKRHERKLKKSIGKTLNRYRKGEAKHQAKLAERSWQLSLPLSAYTGVYKNEKLGQAEFKMEGEKLAISMGQLRTVATPFPHDDCMRVELIPGSGIVICFGVENGEVKDVSVGRDVFEKVK